MGSQETVYSRLPGSYLVGESGHLHGWTISLDKKSFVIGRDEVSCDFVLKPSFVSRRHAAFETDESGRTTLKDLGSKFGTFVNGKRVTELVLSNGDLVEFGSGGLLTFRFHSDPGQTGITIPSDSREPLRPSASRGTFPQTAPPPRTQPASATMMLDFGTRQVVRLGRDPDNNIVLNDPGVSRYHAQVTYGPDGQPVLVDLGSKNGTYVNGHLLTGPRVLRPDDCVLLSGYLIRVIGRRILRTDLGASRILAERITQKFGAAVRLHDISLALLPCEFVGLLGPSGCGKSLLMDALNGLRPAAQGTVYLNELSLYDNFNTLQRSIGYVPQHDVLHESLSVEQTLYYAAKLRLPGGKSRKRIDEVVKEVITTVGLDGHCETAFRQLSGGQQKRLSLGIELITKPNFLFLDEPTSPLDPETTENMMMLFRKLADQGRIVVMVTHKFEKFFEMHQVVILSNEGYLAFFGPPKKALEYFDCKGTTEIYRKLNNSKGQVLAERFRASPEYQQYVASRITESRALKTESVGTIAPADSNATGSHGRADLAQWWTLTRRTLKIKLQDRKNTALLLLQAPIIAFILVVVIGAHKNDAKTLFISAVIAIWFGANNAIREIVAEGPIYVRERRFNLKIPSYVLSKFTVLAGIGLLQSLLFVGVLTGFNLFSSSDFINVFVVLYLTALGGITTALFFSAIVRTTEKAMTVLPLLLIPQLLLSGFLKPVKTFYVDLRTGRPATIAQYKRFKNSQGVAGGMKPSMARVAPHVLPPDPVARYTGLGVARPISALVTARWSIDGLVHAVGLHDKKARDNLAAELYVEGYSLVLQGKSDAAVRDAYRKRLWLDFSVLGGFSLLFLALTMWALKRKDIL